MTTRPHPHLSAVGPTVRALPLAAGQHEPRTPRLAVVDGLASGAVIPKRAQWWLVGLSFVGLAVGVAWMAANPERPASPPLPAAVPPVATTVASAPPSTWAPRVVAPVRPLPIPQPDPKPVYPTAQAVLL